MSYLLDTNACIKYLSERDSLVKSKLSSSSPEDIALCAVTKAELLYGAYKSSRRESNLQLLERFFERFKSFPFDDRAAEEYGHIRAALAVAGTPIGPNDLLIAAIAVANKVTLVTHNTNEFNRVKGLQIEDWELP